MLEIGMNGVAKDFGFKNVLENVSLEIMTGERVAIIGHNGTGKTTILKIISGEEKPDRGIVTVRSQATVGYLEQIPRITDSTETVREALRAPFTHIHELDERMRVLEVRLGEEQNPDKLERAMRSYAHAQREYEAQGGWEVEETIAKVVSGFGLSPLLEQRFSTLSGGEKTIVKLAATMLRAPDILLLDEPTNHLDLSTLEWFEDYLRKYRGTVVIVSHDRYFLDRVATKTILLQRGECLTFNGNYTRAMEERDLQIMVEFKQYKTQQQQIAAMRAAAKRYREWGELNKSNAAHFRKAKEIESRIEKMEKLERPQAGKAKIPIGFAGGRTGKEVLRLEDVNISIGERTLLRGANATVIARERVCLMGDNGTGKTTLLRAMFGEAPYEGRITLFPSAKLGYIPQEIRFADDQMTVLEAFKDEFTCTEGEGRNILAQYFFYGEHVFKRVRALSGGEKVLLKLAILVQREINFLVLDEPTNHIDIETRNLLEESLSGFSGTILFVSHDRYFIRKMAGRILELRDGALHVHTGGWEDFEKSRARAEG